MRITWAVLVAALLGLTAGRTRAGEPLLLPDAPPHAAADAADSHFAGPAEIGEDENHRLHGLLAPLCRPGSCMYSIGEQAGACFDHLAAWLSYHPCRVTNLYYQRVPYNPQPPLYTYFFYPPVVDGPGVAYPCCNRRHCGGAAVDPVVLEP